MFSTKLTKLEREDKLSRLFAEKKLHEDRFYKEIEDWKQLITLPVEVQIKRKEVWDKYFEEVRSGSPSYALYQEQHQAFLAKDWKKVKSLSQQAREIRENGDVETIKKPSFPDPEVLSLGVVIRTYLTLLKGIRELQGLNHW